MASDTSQLRQIKGQGVTYNRCMRGTPGSRRAPVVAIGRASEAVVTAASGAARARTASWGLCIALGLGSSLGRSCVCVGVRIDC